MSWLTKQIADSVCTMIAIGYLKEAGAAGNIQYAVDSELPDYTKAQKSLKSVGVSLNISKSISQDSLAWILAETPRVPTIADAQKLIPDYWKYLQAITNSANSLPQPPYGAYIGGMATVSKIFIIGPSSLEQYTPKYRAPDDSTVELSYNNAVDATNAALQCMTQQNKSTSTPTGMTLTFCDANQKITTLFQKGHLFKSYHGMIQSLVKYATTIDQNVIYFEIALGSNTSKVSSCLPCSMFMWANKKPATSTHLGRGDNWNIPSGSNLTNDWEAKIISYYKTGKAAAGVKLPTAVTATLNTYANDTNIAAIFLEALTFEGKFTDKIIATLPTS